MNKYLLPILVAGATAAHGQSFLLHYFANDVISVETDATATYTASGAPTATATSVASYAGGGLPPGGAPGVSGPFGTPTGLALTPVTTPLTSPTYLADIASLTPDSGTAKDYISSHSEFQYHVGDNTTADAFSLILSAHASAQTAQLSGFPADAKLVVNWHLLIEPGSFAAVTKFDLPDVTALTTQGIWSAAWVQHPSLGVSNSVDVTHGGSEIEQNGFYTYDVTYTLDVPFGTDPDINVSLDGGVAVTPVPEVATLWQISLLALPAALLLRRRRR
ncbi:MAG TPA: hypothetical protein VMB21_08820 [Candidatus Limnocylindria bacterium]|jgi:hypothetical protein|nr:hypothetical protein [Candidatus Limnocylindria bacterium]